MFCYVLIIGVFSGIGLVLVEVLVWCGCVLILVVCQCDVLESIVYELVQCFGVEVLFCICDFFELL